MTDEELENPWEKIKKVPISSYKIFADPKIGDTASFEKTDGKAHVMYLFTGHETKWKPYFIIGNWNRVEDSFPENGYLFKYNDTYAWDLEKNEHNR